MSAPELRLILVVRMASAPLLASHGPPLVLLDLTSFLYLFQLPSTPIGKVPKGRSNYCLLSNDETEAIRVQDLRCATLHYDLSLGRNALRKSSASDMDEHLTNSRYQPHLLGSTGDLYQGTIADTAKREASKHESHHISPLTTLNGSSEANYFRNAQW